MTVRFTAEARRDIVSILEAIAGNHPRAAAGFDLAIEAATERIDRFPRIGRIVHPPLGIRSVVLPRWGYQLLYVDRADGAVVLTVRSTKRLPHFAAEPPETDTTE